MQRDRLESSLLKQSNRTGAGAGKFEGTLEKLPGAIGQAQQTINFPRQLRERLGAPAVLLGHVQVVRYFEDHRDLSGQGTGTANILLGDAGAVQSIEHAEHAEQAPLGAQERDCQQLPGLVLRDRLQIHAGEFFQVVRPEDFFGPQGAGG
jgi:hypothetical protein